MFSTQIDAELIGLLKSNWHTNPYDYWRRQLEQRLIFLRQFEENQELRSLYHHIREIVLQTILWENMKRREMSKLWSLLERNSY